ncbi:hypothetical protein P43SY_009665 [Pythium insidiosum]|uniref:Uncharacterized protein n=1 Tax=Pythium insidiosum TaxID=114742 RepID=A0AAD5LD65_PYTIN|nr:hypothetical protein P43SY_009665 [Pythium insidiosum]
MGSNITMKYTTLKFIAAASGGGDAQWHALLHDIVAVHRQVLEEGATQRQRLQSLEDVLKAKDALLEQALAAKQSLEDDLFANFCAVLNAKKAEIARLQQELSIQNAWSEAEP